MHDNISSVVREKFINLSMQMHLMNQLFLRQSVVRVEFDLSKSLNEDAPESPIELLSILIAVRVEFDLRITQCRCELLNADVPILLPRKLSVVRMEFDLRESPILLCQRLSVVRVEFNFRESPNADAPESSIGNSRESLNALTPESPIEFSARLRVVRVEFDLRTSLNTDAHDKPIELLSTMVDDRRNTWSVYWDVGLIVGIIVNFQFLQYLFGTIFRIHVRIFSPDAGTNAIKST